MTEVRIVAMVGMKGAGKSTAVRYLTAKGWPKVVSGGDTLLEIRNLIAAGQHEIVLDGVESWKEYVELKREFPRQVKTIAVVAPRLARWKRLAADAKKDLTRAEVRECDRIEVEDLGVGQMIAAAEAYIYNNTAVGDLHMGLEEALEEVKNESR